MPRPSHSPWFDLRNNIRWWVQMYRHLIISYYTVRKFFVQIPTPNGSYIK
jgi:hypothetical protein